MIVEAFRALTAEQVIARLDAAQIANARMNDMHDVWNHEQLRARGRWKDVSTSVGSIPALTPPGQPDTYAPRMDPVPALGEHTDRILAELGITGAEVAHLRAAGAV
jgi:itaconate CoA-transferase